MAEQKMSRKVVTRSGRKYKGYFPSKKLCRMVQWESLLERDAFLLFEFSPGVIKYQEQPEMIEYEEDGEIRRYYPDIEVVLTNGEIIHFEVKPSSKMTSPELVKKYGAIKNHYSRIGRDFRILLDNKIRIEPQLVNLKQLAAAQHRPLDYVIIQEKAINLVGGEAQFTCLTLAEVLGLSNVLILIARGDLCFDLSRDIFADDNFLRLPMEADRDSLFF